MPIEFRCTQCGKLLRTPDETAGKRAKCPECAAILSIPIPAPQEPPQGPAADGPPGGAFSTPPPAKPEGPAPMPAEGPQPGSPFAAGAPVNPYQSPFAPAAAAPPTAAPGGFGPARIDFGDIFARTWKIFASQWGTCLLALLVVMLLSAGVFLVPMLAAGVVAGAANDELLTAAVFGLGLLAAMVFSLWIGIGQALFFLKIARDGQASMNDLFAGGPYLGRVLGATILFLLIVMVGTVLCYVPGIIFGLMFSQYFYLIVDRNVGVIESLRLSSQVTDGNKLMLFAIQLVVQMAAQAVVMMTCGLGILAAAPFLALMNAVIYLAMTGQPTADRILAAPPPGQFPPAGPTA